MDLRLSHKFSLSDSVLSTYGDRQGENPCPTLYQLKKKIPCLPLKTLVELNMNRRFSIWQADL